MVVNLSRYDMEEIERNLGMVDMHILVAFSAVFETGHRVCSLSDVRRIQSCPSALRTLSAGLLPTAATPKSPVVNTIQAEN